MDFSLVEFWALASAKMPGDDTHTTVVKSTINVPLLGQAKTYELWKKEVLLWKKITEIKPEKVGITLALALPEECTFGKNIIPKMTQRKKGFDKIKSACIKLCIVVTLR